ncbi:PAS domain S-box-containing protein [Methanolinea mesophila]|uniref:PAS domain S-box protein n=1 Tax=Methanolinea mesophila TaxID=547055 RepID=UPI001AE63BA4|nr:PAS domain S-box protein [Methanolinea mesophila]MBP1928972.1 PAS domain S-box-containing protein [Methanolinea mesophila]
MTSNHTPDWDRQREKIIGLGETSIHKSYYPELQQRLSELLRKNQELAAAYQQLAAAEEDLRSHYNELSARERELRESEEKFREIFDKVNDAIFIHERGEDLFSGRFLEVNEVACRLVGATREALLDLHPLDFLTRKSDLPAGEINGRLNATGHVLFETWLSRTDGTVFPAEVNAHHVTLLGREVTLAVVRDITDRKLAEEALNRATEKLNLLNQITFTDIQNAIFSLHGYFELERIDALDEGKTGYREKEIAIVRSISETLKFARQYQNLGLRPPSWQSVTHSFLYAISHLDLGEITRDLGVDGISIFADPHLENVFFTLAENVLLHGKTATAITLSARETQDGLMILFGDNGVGVPADMKEKIFDRRYEEKKGMGLFLSREILSITGITIRENGTPGTGACFEILVPRGVYRIEEKDRTIPVS